MTRNSASRVSVVSANQKPLQRSASPIGDLGRMAAEPQRSDADRPALGQAEALDHDLEAGELAAARQSLELLEHRRALGRSPVDRRSHQAPELEGPEGRVP